MVPSHYLSHCWNIVNLTLRNKLQWNLHRNLYIFIQKNVFENVIWKMSAILSRPECVNYALCLFHAMFCFVLAATAITDFLQDYITGSKISMWRSHLHMHSVKENIAILFKFSLNFILKGSIYFPNISIVSGNVSCLFFSKQTINWAKNDPLHWCICITSCECIFCLFDVIILSWIIMSLVSLTLKACISQHNQIDWEFNTINF